MTYRWRIAGWAMACTLGGSALRGDPINLVTNGDFETGDFAGWAATKPAFTTVVCGNSTYPAFSGNCAALFAGDSNAQFVDLSQILPTTPGVSYTLSFWVDFEQPGGLLQAAFATDSSPGPSAGNCDIDIQNPTQGYVPESCTITADASEGQLIFNQGTSGNYILLDDVSVVATPEPSTFPVLRDFSSSQPQFGVVAGV